MVEKWRKPPTHLTSYTSLDVFSYTLMMLCSHTHTHTHTHTHLLFGPTLKLLRLDTISLYWLDQSQSFVNKVYSGCTLVLTTTLSLNIILLLR